MDKINKNIYIGNSSDADNLDNDRKITAILNVAFDLNRKWFNEKISLKIGLVDGPSEENKITVPLAIEVLKKLILNNCIILVHCHQGQNRSPFIVAKTLSLLNDTSWVEEFQKIKEIRPEVFIKDWMYKFD
jgi:protein-tyrosine phosphatase